MKTTNQKSKYKLLAAIAAPLFAFTIMLSGCSTPLTAMRTAFDDCIKAVSAGDAEAFSAATAAMPEGKTADMNAADLFATVNQMRGAVKAGNAIISYNFSDAENPVLYMAGDLEYVFTAGSDDLFCMVNEFKVMRNENGFAYADCVIGLFITAQFTNQSPPETPEGLEKEMQGMMYALPMNTGNGTGFKTHMLSLDEKGENQIPAYRIRLFFVEKDGWKLCGISDINQ